MSTELSGLRFGVYTLGQEALTGCWRVGVGVCMAPRGVGGGQAGYRAAPPGAFTALPFARG